MTTNTNPTPILIPLIRALYPSLLAQQIVGVQPMTSSAAGSFSLETEIPYPENPRRQFSRKWFSAKSRGEILALDQVQSWCVDTFGPQPVCPDAWCRWYHYSTRTWRFRDEEDYVLFSLKWS